jgi:hypothetical protein
MYSSISEKLIFGFDTSSSDDRNFGTEPKGHDTQSLKQLLGICKDIDVGMHTMYGNVIHNRWNAFDQNWACLQEQLHQYLSVAHGIRIRQKEAC